MGIKYNTRRIPYVTHTEVLYVVVKCVTSTGITYNLFFSVTLN